MGILRAHQVKHICKSLKPRGLCLKDRKQKAGVAFSFGALIFPQQLKEGEHRDVLLPGGEDTVASTRRYRSTLSSEQGPHGPPSDQRWQQPHTHLMAFASLSCSKLSKSSTRRQQDPLGEVFAFGRQQDPHSL